MSSFESWIIGVFCFIVLAPLLALPWLLVIWLFRKIFGQKVDASFIRKEPYSGD